MVRLKSVPQQAKPDRDAGTPPTELHLLLAPAQTLVRTFDSEKRLQSYRRMLYAVNKQATYRYRTMRDESEMWAIIIWRMK